MKLPSLGKPALKFRIDGMVRRLRSDLTGDFCSSRIERLETDRNRENAEEDVYGGTDRRKLRQIEVLLSQGKRCRRRAKRAGFVDQTYYRWRREYDGLQWNRLGRADLTVEKQILKDIAEGNF